MHPNLLATNQTPVNDAGDSANNWLSWGVEEDLAILLISLANLVSELASRPMSKTMFLR